MNKSNVRFDITPSQLTTAGFVKAPNRAVYLHGSFPGLIFAVVDSAAACAANGGAFCMFTDGTVLDVYTASKLVLGQDVGHHLRLHNGEFPNIAGLPGPAKPFVMAGKRLGLYNDANGRNQVVSTNVLGADGLQWNQVFSHGKCYVLAVISRVPFGVAWSKEAANSVVLGVTEEELKNHPRTTVKFGTVLSASIINVAAADKPLLQVARWNSSTKSCPDIIQYTYDAIGGEAWLHCPCDLKKLLADAADGFITAQYSGDLASVAADVIADEIAAIKEGTYVPFAVKIGLKMPRSASEEFGIHFRTLYQSEAGAGARPLSSVSTAGNTGSVGWDSPDVQAYVDNGSPGPIMLDGGYYPYSGVTKPTPKTSGQPNSTADASVVNATGLTKTYAVNDLPKLNFTAEVNGVQKRVVRSYDLLKPLSPLAHATGEEVDVTLDAMMSAAVNVTAINARSRSNDAEKRATDDADTAAVRAAPSIGSSIAYDAAFEPYYEPLTRNLVAIAGRVDKKVSKMI